MENNLIDQEFVDSLDTTQLNNYFQQLVYEYTSLEKHRKGLKNKYFIIVQRNIADTFTWDDYHQRIADYQQEDTEFALRLQQKNAQLEHVLEELKRRISINKNGRNY